MFKFFGTTLCCSKETMMVKMSCRWLLLVVAEVTLYRILMAMSMFVTPLETFRRTDTEENPDQTAQQPTADERGADEAQLQRLEALFSGSNEGDDETNGDGAQSDVEQGVGSRVLVPVQTASVVLVVRTGTAERRVVYLDTHMKLLTSDSLQAMVYSLTNLVSNSMEQSPS
jgi:hypothetical protein